MAEGNSTLPMLVRDRGRGPTSRRRVAGRTALTLAASLALLLGLDLPAATQENPIRIGVLGLGPRRMPVWHCGPRDPHQDVPEPRLESPPIDAVGLRDELEKLGYVEDRPENKAKPGRRFVLDVRQGNLDEVKRYAQQFAQERVDIIFAITTLPTKAAQEATQANPIPIVFVAVSEPVGDGLAQSLARPGGLITGVSTQLIEGSGKRVEVFKEMLPGLRRLLTIYKPGFPVALRSMVEVRKVADDLGLRLREKHANNRQEIRAALADVRRDTVDGILFAVDSTLISNADLVLAKSLEQRVPAFGIIDFLAEWGALAAYGPSPYQQGRRAAYYVDKIVKGANVGDLPVEPLDPTFVVNLKAAACLGVTVPPAVLHQADRVIR